MGDQQRAYPAVLSLSGPPLLHRLCADLAKSLGGDLVDTAELTARSEDLGRVDRLIRDADVCVVSVQHHELIAAIAASADAGRYDGALLAVDVENTPNGALAEAIVHGADDAVSAHALQTEHAPAMLEKVLAIATRRRKRQRLVHELSHAADAARARADSLAKRVGRLEGEAWTDPLTGLANRRQLGARLDRMFAEAVRYGAELSCVMIDLDGFKQLNDRLGHSEGDACLKQVAKAITESVRASDVAARFGGDEFVVLMPRTPAAEAGRVADRLRDAFHRRVANWCEPCGANQLGISIGVASVASAKPLTAEGLIEAADRAMYAAKAAGGIEIMCCHANGLTNSI